MTKLNKNIIFLGMVSFFTDLSSEIIFPILPLFLEHFLKASKFEIGLIEGSAQLTASVLKVISGYISDKIGRRKPVVVLGYAISTVVKPLLFLSVNWKDVFVLRILERAGKGIRTPPRDALLSQYVNKDFSGRAFGFHRGMDTAGAVFGSLIVMMFFYFFGVSEETFRNIFLFSFLPGFIALIILVIFVKEKKSQYLSNSNHTSFCQSVKKLPGKFYVLLTVQILFTILSINFAFVILKVNSSGISMFFIPVVYLLFNFVYAVMSYPIGLISDKIGKGTTLSLTYFSFGISSFILSGNIPWVGILGFVLYGIFMAGNEVVSRAIVSDVVPLKLKGTAYGIYHTATGIAVFISSSLTGIIWDFFGSFVPFFVSSIGTLIIAIFSYLKLKKLF